MTALEQAATDARKALADVNERIRVAVGEAKRAAQAVFADELLAASAAVVATTEAVHAAREEASTAHPWIGRKVTRAAISGSFSYRGRPKADGVIEAFKRGDSYIGSRPPTPGSLVIRYLKKDGEPGAKTDGCLGDRLPGHWKFTDGEAA